MGVGARLVAFVDRTLLSVACCKGEKIRSVEEGCEIEKYSYKMCFAWLSYVLAPFRLVFFFSIRVTSECLLSQKNDLLEFLTIDLLDFSTIEVITDLLNNHKLSFVNGLP